MAAQSLCRHQGSGAGVAIQTAHCGATHLYDVFYHSPQLSQAILADQSASTLLTKKRNKLQADCLKRQGTILVPTRFLCQQPRILLLRLAPSPPLKAATNESSRTTRTEGRFNGTMKKYLQLLLNALLAGYQRLDKSFAPSLTISRLRAHTFVPSDVVYIFHISLATLWITLMQDPAYPLKLALPVLYAFALLIPFTSQFFLPATPVFVWILTWYSSRFIPPGFRPTISVSLLPTLETVLYGANISDILTRFTHPILDLIAWLPYGLFHFVLPFVVAIFLYLFRVKGALRLWARTFGYMNITGVLIQLVLPCSPPWYEVIYGLTPADYSMKGSPGGLARIDRLFGGSAYTTGFTNSPLVFGAFPSLHAGNSTLEALFVSHFFPGMTKVVWVYAGVMYWATMYLTHHYLIDVVGGACLATMFFYLFMEDEWRGPLSLMYPPNLAAALGITQASGTSSAAMARGGKSKYEVYDLEDPRRSNRGALAAREFDLSDEEPTSDEEEVDITFRSPQSLPNTPSNPTHPSSNPQTRAKLSMNTTPTANGKGHRHTASIASLIRGEERGPEDGWSPVAGTFGFAGAKGRSD